MVYPYVDSLQIVSGNRRGSFQTTKEKNYRSRHEEKIYHGSSQTMKRKKIIMAKLDTKRKIIVAR